MVRCFPPRALPFVSATASAGRPPAQGRVCPHMSRQSQEGQCTHLAGIATHAARQLLPLLAGPRRAAEAHRTWPRPSALLTLWLPRGAPLRSWAREAQVSAGNGSETTSTASPAQRAGHPAAPIRPRHAPDTPARVALSGWVRKSPFRARALPRTAGGRHCNDANRCAFPTACWPRPRRKVVFLSPCGSRHV